MKTELIELSAVEYAIAAHNERCATNGKEIDADYLLDEIRCLERREVIAESPYPRKYLEWTHKQELGFREWKSQKFGKFNCHFLITAFGSQPNHFYGKLYTHTSIVSLDYTATLESQQAACEDFIKEFLTIVN